MLLCFLLLGVAAFFVARVAAFLLWICFRELEFKDSISIECLTLKMLVS